MVKENEDGDAITWKRKKIARIRENERISGGGGDANAVEAVKVTYWAVGWTGYLNEKRFRKLR